MAIDNRNTTVEEIEYIAVEVVYAASPEQQLLKSLSVPAGTTVEEVVHHSGILNQFAEIDLKKNRLGIWGKRVGTETVIQPHDRIEVYRPLLIDPKEARKLRVKRQCLS